MQQSVTNRHVVRDTGRLVGIFPTVSLPSSWLSFFSYHIFVTLPMNHMADSPVLSMTIREKADQAHQDRVDDTVGAQVAASSTVGNDDEEEDDPWK